MLLKSTRPGWKLSASVLKAEEARGRGSLRALQDAERLGRNALDDSTVTTAPDFRPPRSVHFREASQSCHETRLSSGARCAPTRSRKPHRLYARIAKSPSPAMPRGRLRAAS